MPEVLPYVMPLDMQTAALAEISECGDPSSLIEITDVILEAEQWFTDTVLGHIGKPVKHYAFTEAERMYHSGGTGNSDIHVDNLSTEYGTKFLCTISDIAFAGTIYFPGLTKQSAGNGRHTTDDLFLRDATGMLVPRLSPALQTGHRLQGTNGQISKFAINTDVHAAAPLPRGAKKILFVLKAKI